MLRTRGIAFDSTLTVGTGQKYSTIASAITASGSRWTVRLADTGASLPAQSLTFTNTSATAVKSSPGTGITFDTHTDGVGWRVGDWVSTDGIKYHRIKKFIDINTLELWGPWSGTTGNFSVQGYYLDRRTILLSPGNYSYAGSTLPPGFNIVGIDRDSVFVGEDIGIAGEVGENFISNLTVGPSTLYGSSDVLTSGMNTAALGYGARFIGKNLKLMCGSLNGNHNGGNLSWPVMTGGYSCLFDSEIHLMGSAGSLSAGGDASTRSIVHWKNVPIYNDTDVQSVTGGLGISSFEDAYNSADYLDIYLENLSVVWLDAAKNPSTAAAIGSINLYGTNNKTYISGLNSDVRNTSSTAAATEKPVCIQVSDGEVHINNCPRLFATGGVTGPANAGEALVIAGGTTHVRNSNLYGLKYGVNISGGTLNLHNTIVDGGTNSIIRSAGTVNVEKGVILIGPVSGTLSSTIRGTVTLNGATPVTVTTTRVHTASRIKLSRQVAAGTMGHFGIGTITDNTSFTIVGQALDTSAVMWELEE